MDIQNALFTNQIQNFLKSRNPEPFESGRIGRTDIQCQHFLGSQIRDQSFFTCDMLNARIMEYKHSAFFVRPKIQFDLICAQRSCHGERRYGVFRCGVPVHAAVSADSRIGPVLMIKILHGCLLDYSLTPPAVMPLIRYFLTKTLKRMTGIQMTTAVAASSPQCISSKLM